MIWAKSTIKYNSWIIPTYCAIAYGLILALLCYMYTLTRISLTVKIWKNDYVILSFERYKKKQYGGGGGGEKKKKKWKKKKFLKK